MKSDWDEIKKLAADFQKIQLSSTLQKLSERNCIEIVTLLIQKQLIDVIYTIDGKEYITPQHLEREILDELHIHGGRLNLVEISKILNVDLIKINVIAEKIANTFEIENNEKIYLINGQLLTELYITRIATEINEKLIQIGEISISDLTVQYDLPTDFIENHIIGKHLGKIIRGRQHPSNSRVLYTQAYMSRCKAKIRGALAAVTQPISVKAIAQQIQIDPKIMFSLIEEISPSGIFTSKLDNAQYIPHIYTKMQVEWVNSFYKQNGFLEYDSISKLGISDPKKFIKKQFPNENLTYLKKCAVGSKLIDLTLVTAINECNATESYIDLSTLLPSNMDEEDIDELFTLLIKLEKVPNNFIILKSTVFTKEFLDNILKPCKDLAIENANKSIKSGIYQQYIIEKQLTNKGGDQDLEYVDSKAEKREERRKKASSGKGGGGTQGRETKTKSVKKHYRGGGGGRNANDDNSDDDYNDKLAKKNVKSLVLISFEDVFKILQKSLTSEGLEDFVEEITKIYYDSINQLALTIAQSLFESNPQTNRKQAHANLQDKLNALLIDMRLYEKGLKLFHGETQSQLEKYLLKSYGSNICNEIFMYVVTECNLNIKSTASLTIEQRNKIIQECDPEYKNALTELNKALNKTTIDEFLSVVENVIMKSFSVTIKKIDKKKDRSVILDHKEKLVQQMQDTEEPALILHIATLILFTHFTGNIIHASGKFVPQLLLFLTPHMNDEQNSLLNQYHDLVVKFLSTKNQNDDQENDIKQKLKEFKYKLHELIKMILNQKS